MPKSTRQKRHQKTKQAILNIAKQMVLKEGYANLSLRAIAREADYSPAGLYEYFDSKDQLLSALSKELNKELINELSKIPFQLPPDEKLLEMCLAYVNFALENAELYQLMSSIPSKRHSLNDPLSEGSAYNLFLTAVQLVIDENKISTEPGFGPEEITYGLWVTLHGMVTLRMSYLRNFDADFASVNRRIIENLIQNFGNKKS